VVKWSGGLVFGWLGDIVVKL